MTLAGPVGSCSSVTLTGQYTAYIIYLLMSSLKNFNIFRFCARIIEKISAF